MTERSSTPPHEENFNALLEAARVAEIKLRDGGAYPINGETWRLLRNALLPYKGVASYVPSETRRIKYVRMPIYDKRITRGDDYAGDAWLRWTAVDQIPEDLDASTSIVR